MLPGSSRTRIARLDALLARASANPRLLLMTANAHASAKNYPRAEELLVTAIEVNPASLGAYSLLGRLYLAQKRLDAARAQFEKLAARQERPVGGADAHRHD